MPKRFYLVIFLVPIAIIVFVAVFLLTVQRGGDIEPTVGLTAAATLQSPAGDAMGTVTFRQAATGVLVMADVRGLEPGGHAFIIHEVGSCTPDFDAAGDHFNPEDAEHGLIHPTWKRGELTGGHGGDLPNIYAAFDGSRPRRLLHPRRHPGRWSPPFPIRRRRLRHYRARKTRRLRRRGVGYGRSRRLRGHKAHLVPVCGLIDAGLAPSASGDCHLPSQRTARRWDLPSQHRRLQGAILGALGEKGAVHQG